MVQPCADSVGQWRVAQCPHRKAPPSGPSGMPLGPRVRTDHLSGSSPASRRWLRNRKLVVVVSPQQCGEHGRLADLGLAGPGEQCQPPVLCKSPQV
jgi:hypothetical protein